MGNNKGHTHNKKNKQKHIKETRDKQKQQQMTHKG